MKSGKSSQKSKTFSIYVKILICFSLLSCTRVTVTAYQLSTYEIGVYDCSDMSKDCEAFFENLGFDTYLIVGTRINGTRHQWIVVDTGLFSFEFECTVLMPVSPSLFNDYDNLLISDGHIINGEQTKEEPTYIDW